MDHGSITTLARSLPVYEREVKERRLIHFIMPTIDNVIKPMHVFVRTVPSIPIMAETVGSTRLRKSAMRKYSAVTLPKDELRGWL
jgi:hypothetical protein